MNTYITQQEGEKKRHKHIESPLQSSQCNIRGPYNLVSYGAWNLYLLSLSKHCL